LDVFTPGKYKEPSLYRSAKGERVVAGTDPLTTKLLPPELSTIAYDPGF
jgi:hypothetical protein